MTETERQLLNALTALDSAVKGMSTSGGKPNLPAHFATIDQLATQLPRSTAPDLLHYLQKKSYEKARLWLEAELSQIQKGGCRR